MVRAGDFRNPITIESTSELNDAYGEPDKTWSTFATTWAAIEPQIGKEFFDASQVNAELVTRFRLRYHAGITPAMRVVYNSRNFNIESIVNINERNIELILTCIEDV